MRQKKKAARAGRWTVFPVKKIKKFPESISVLLDDPDLGNAINYYGTVDMDGKRNIEIWYSDGYINSSDRRRLEYAIACEIERLKIARKTVFIN